MLTALAWLWPDGTVRLRVFHRGCGRPLGFVARRGNGAVVWVSFSDAIRRSNRPGRRWRPWRVGEVLSPPVDFNGVFEVPDRVQAVCARHGVGLVSTVDIRRPRGKVDVDLI